MLFASLTANSQTTEPRKFLEVFNELRTTNNQKVSCNYENDETQRRILFEYGAVFVSNISVLPTKCLFNNQDDIDEYISGKLSCFSNFGNGKFCLQPKAKESLLRVFTRLGGYKFVARNDNRTTSNPIDGINADWAFRSYCQAEENWRNNLIRRGFKGKKKSEVVKAETKEKPYMYSYAIPGGSQHHLGLAIDVNSEGARKCKKNCVEALEANGWFRTIRGDPYHFTFLGYTKTLLPSRGLKEAKCEKDGFTYWVPNVPKYMGYENWRCEDV